MPLHTRLRGCPRSSDGRNGRYGSFVRSAKECVASDRRFRSAHDARLDRLRPLRTFCRFQSYVDFRFPATFSAFATGRSFVHVRTLPCPGSRRPRDQFPLASLFYQSASFSTSIADPSNVERQRLLPTRCVIAFFRKASRRLPPCCVSGYETPVGIQIADRSSPYALAVPSRTQVPTHAQTTASSASSNAFSS